MQTEKILSLSPDDILIRDNVRFNIKPYRVERLAADILESNGVRVPIIVEELKTPIDGKKFALSEGRYRVEAVTKLNREQAAGLTIPCRVVAEQTEAERLKRQVAENNERENMSPMDQAIAIQKMLSAGLSRMDVRNSLSIPGGRKGIKVQPASNSFINIRLSFLEFPKAIQNKIHDGTIGTNTARLLYKQPKEKWDEIVAKAEEARIKEIDQEEDDERKYLEAAKREEEVAQEHAKTSTQLEETKAKLEAAQVLMQQKKEALLQATDVFITSKGEERKKATEHKKAAEQELVASRQAAEAAEKELAKLADKAKTVAEKAEAAKARLEEARAAKANNKGAKAPTTGKAVAQAAKDVTGQAKKLNAQQILDCVKSLTVLSKPQAKYPKTLEIGALLEQAIMGQISDGQLRLGIARIVGEEAMPKAAAKK